VSHFFSSEAKPKTARSKSRREMETPLALLFADLESELATTRRMLERVPEGRDDWRPHEKCRSLGELATHVAQLPGFGILMLTQDEFDGAAGRRQPSPANNAERLQMFESVSGELRRLVEQMTWKQKPRANMVRSAMITHLAHHRAQLGVYLRLLDVPVPASYGPSADEQAFPG